jgi:hypothetical protein
MLCDELNERSPGNHSLHLGEEHLLAGHSAAQVQIKTGLFHCAKRMSQGAYACQTTGEVLQSFLCERSDLLKINETLQPFTQRNTG